MKKIALLPLTLLALFGCGDSSPEDDNPAINGDDVLQCSDTECSTDEGHFTGYLEEEEDLNVIPKDINLAAFAESDIPSYASLEHKFPPIGNQGSYGTCVAWATAYNLKTALNATEKGWGSVELAKAENQTSPKDLWLAIDGSKSCEEGTTYQGAFEALIQKGAASMALVPYNMGNCSGTSPGDANNKLDIYRKIANGTTGEGMNLDNFKSYLAQGRPVVISARLGDRFGRWPAGNVILSSDTYSKESGHAMVLVGYDDSKGAFRVRNSWGTNWADNGSIWVEYDFFLREFTKAAFIAQNPPPSAINDNPITGYDLLANFAEDYRDPESANPRNRAFYYEIYNNGTEPILASQRWKVYYMYYNAYDANEFQIIFEDYYTSERGDLGEYGEYLETDAFAGGIWNNMNVQPGQKAGEAEFGQKGFYIPYIMPPINGDYYLVVYADAQNVIRENNEDNNFYFIAAANGKPLHFTNGLVTSIVAKPVAATSNVLAKKASMVAPAASVAQLGELNGYTPAEIKALIKQSKQNGVLAKKSAEYRDANGGVRPLRKIAR
jgi:C1A family cysteine protease